MTGRAHLDRGPPPGSAVRRRGGGLQRRVPAGPGARRRGAVRPDRSTGGAPAAVATLDGTILASYHEECDAAKGPDATLEVLDGLFVRLARKTRTEPWAFGIGVGGPVDFSTGRLVAPPIMPGWHGYSIRSWLRERYDALAWVDNDVNLMALGEWHKGEPNDGRDLLYVYLDQGIGAGLVSRGQVFRGDTGAAGDIGHVQVTDDPGIVCRCGRQAVWRPSPAAGA